MTATGPDLARWLLGLDDAWRERLRTEIRDRGLVGDPRTIGLWRTPDERQAPLSPAQQQMLVLQAIRTHNTAYHTVGCVRLTGATPAGRIAAALDAVVQRHDILRTVYPDVAGTPVQEVRDGSLTTTVVDLRAVPEDRRDREVDRILRVSRGTPFDLTRDWPVRTMVVRTADDVQILAVTIHHIAYDGWSDHVFWGEVRAHLESPGTAGEPPPFQYADYAAWQHEIASNPAALRERLRYWRTLLAGAGDGLPVGRHRGTGVTGEKGTSHPVRLDSADTAALAAVVAAGGTTTHVGLVAAAGLFLTAWCGVDDVVLGSPNANRHGEPSRALIGNFVNPYLFRVAATDATTFAETVRRTRDQAIAVTENEIPFTHLVQALDPDRGGDQPLYNVDITLQNAPAVSRTAAGTAVDEVDLAATTSRFDLDINLWEIDGGLVGSLLHRDGVLLPAEGARCAEEFGRFARVLFAEPHLPLAEVRARAGVVRGSRLAGDPLVRRVRAVAAHSPDAPAVTGPHDRTTGYARLVADADRLADQLRAHGATSGTRVLIDAGRGGRAITAMLACLSVEANYTPVDPADLPGRVEQITGAFAPHLVVRSDDTGDWSFTRGPGGGDPLPGAAYTLFTSGTTGVPKGVRIPAAALLNYADWAALEYRLTEGAGVPLLTSVSVDLTVTSVFATLLAGQRVITYPPEEYPGQHVVEALPGQRDLTMVKLTPTHLAMVGPLFERRPAVARTLVVGGEVLPMAAVRGITDTRVYNEYGPTEATVACAAALIGGTEPSEDAPIGVPIAGADLSVLGPAGEPVADGVVGELVVAGPGVAVPGYLDQPRATAAAFLPAPGGTTCYATGDLVWRDPATGNLRFSGRADRQVKIRGRRIELDEIEVVAAGVPGVRHARAALGRDGRLELDLVAHDRLTAGDKAVVRTWETVFDETYRADPSPFAGWTDSVSQRRIPDEDMAEWVTDTVARIRASCPHPAPRVLEIGCGTGLLLTELAPVSGTYTGLDLSLAALAHVRARLDDPAAHGWRDRVHLLHGPADQLPDGEFDLVVLNSVAQYFPAVRYFDTVLAGLVGRLSPQGVAFLGDLRAPEFDEVLARRRGPSAAADPELRISPDYLGPAVAGRSVRCMPKALRATTEMSEYRFDAVIGPEPPGDTPPAGHVVRREVTGLADIRAGLADTPTVFQRVPWSATAAGTPRPADVAAVAAAAGLVAEFEIPRGSAGRYYSVRVADRPCGRSFAPPLGPVARDARLVGEPAGQRQVATDEIARVTADTLAARIGEWARPALTRFRDSVEATAGGKLDHRPSLGATGDTAGTVGDTAGATGGSAAWRRLEPVLVSLLGRQVRPADRFFAVGGNSLLAVQLVNTLRREHGLDVAPRTPFDHPVLGDLAEAVALAAPTPETTDRSPTSAPLTAEQHGVWFGQVTQPSSTAMNVPLFAELPEAVPVADVVVALRRLVDRHDALRVRIGIRDGAPVQWLDSARPPRIDVVDLRRVDLGQATEIAARLARAHLDTPFDLEADPPARFTVVGLPGRTQVLIAVHHVVFDGASEAIVTEEAGELLAALRAGRPARLPDPESYLGHAVRRAEQDGRSADVDFWMARLARVERPGILRHRHPGPGPLTRVRTRITLPAAELATFAASRDMTPFGVVFAAVTRAVADQTGRPEVVLATDYGGRPDGADRLVGLFVNQMLIPCHLSDDSFATACDEVREALADAVGHPNAAYSAVVSRLRSVNPALADRPFQIKVSHVQDQSGTSPWRPVPGLPRDVSPGLTLLCRDGGPDLTLTAEYPAEEFDSADIEALLHRWRAILTHALTKETSP